MDELLNLKDEEYENMNRADKLKYHKKEFKQIISNRRNNMDII